jgi:hypothetical protein
MKVPSNIIQTGKYTSGGEFVEELSNKPYQGHYYELNGSLYTGKEYSVNAVKIIKKQNQNQLYNSTSTAMFSFMSGITSQQLSVPPINSINVNNLSDEGIPLGYSTRFFAQKININPITIKEIDEKSYTSLQGTPLYKTTFIGSYNGVNQNIDQAEAQIPGLKTFLSV